MGISKWNRIETELKNYEDIPLIQDKKIFWKEFEKKSAGIEREIPQNARPILLFKANTWIKAAACLAFCALISFWILVPAMKKPLVKNKIKSIEVFASYSAMIILDDEKGDSTIVWLADLSTNDNVPLETL